MAWNNQPDQIVEYTIENAEGIEAEETESGVWRLRLGERYRVRVVRDGQMPSADLGVTITDGATYDQGTDQKGCLYVADEVTVDGNEAYADFRIDVASGTLWVGLLHDAGNRDAWARECQIIS